MFSFPTTLSTSKPIYLAIFFKQISFVTKIISSFSDIYLAVPTILLSGIVASKPKNSPNLQTFRKPQNLRKRTIGCKNTPKGVTAAENLTKSKTKDNGRRAQSLSKCLNTRTSSTELKKGTDPTDPAADLKSSRNLQNSRKNQGTMTDAPINAQKHRQAMPKARTRTESRTTVIKNKHLNI